MELTKEEAARESGGNRFFASVAFELREDFCKEGQRFYGQGVNARWDFLWNDFLHKGEPALAVEKEGGLPGVLVVPKRIGEYGSFGIAILVSSGDGYIYSDLYQDRVSEYKALEVCRLVCIARFGVVSWRG